MALTFQQALADLKRVGASKAEGDVLLAMFCETIAPMRALNAEPLYDAAQRKRLTYDDLRHIDQQDQVFGLCCVVVDDNFPKSA